MKNINSGKKNNILFDLDGTLTDSALGITNSVKYSLKKFGIPEPDMSLLIKFVGPPLADSFMKYFGFSEEKASLAIDYYREYYRVSGILENKVYPGIPELLEKLRTDGKTLVLATSKPAVFSERILKHFDLYKYFSFLAGSELDGRRVNKDEVIAYALENTGIDKNDAVMVGDRHHDIAGAKLNHMTSVGVLYGYGSREELTEADADYIAEDASGLYNILLNI